ncbi:CbtB-domain containing protein, partial [Acinetobacter baumannii]
FLGLGLVFVAGFAPATVLHNAAHDFRHAQNFPCH